MKLPIEDNYDDVLRKAVWGLRLTPSDLVRPSGVPLQTLTSLLEGTWNDDAGRSLARTLGLREESLAALAEGRWQPSAEMPTTGFRRFTLPYADVSVNLYLAWDSSSREAALFDTGPDASVALDFCAANDLQLKSLFLTHTHEDHIMDVGRVAERTGCAVFVHHKEAMRGATPFRTPRTFTLGSLSIEARHTWGHSFGGTSYFIRGLSKPVAMVGDALFAGSIGRPFVSYPQALETIERELFSLPEETVLCPGHGPSTSVGEERHFNPFFP